MSGVLDFLGGAFKNIMGVLSDLLNAVIVLLPDSPFTFLEADETMGPMLRMLNWFIPFGAMVAVLETWLLAVSGYYILQALLRWGKAIK